MAEQLEAAHVMGLATRIVLAHLSNNPVQADALPALIQDVFRTLSDVGLETAGKPLPAVAVRRSVFADHIVCLEDGRKLKMLKRHLKTAYDMTPDQYRKRWNLPADYPMVAPDYARLRSALAKQLGLGTRRRGFD